MKLLKRQLLLWALLFSTVFASADIVVLHDGTSYSGHYTPAGNGTLSFTDNQGIHYDLPVGDVQSLVFSNAADHLTLRNGQNLLRPTERNRDDFRSKAAEASTTSSPYATSARSSSPDRRLPLRRTTSLRWSFRKAQTS